MAAVGAVSGKAAQIKATSAASAAFTDQAMTVAADLKTCTITSSTYAYWDDTVQPTIQTSTDGGVTWVTAGTATYAVQYPGGVVVFAVALAGGTEVRASGSYFAVSVMGEASEWSVDVDSALLDATVFGDSWKEYVPGLNGATVTIKRFWMDDYFFSYLGNKIILVLYVDEATNLRYEGYAELSKDAIDSKVAALVTESASLTFTGPMYYRSA